MHEHDSAGPWHRGVRSVDEVADAEAQAWRDGFVHWKLDPMQLEVYRLVRSWMAEGKSLWGVLDMARRTGKDAISIACALEDCWQRPRIRVPYAAPTEDSVSEQLLPTAEWLLEGCPAHMRPEWVASKHRYQFPNGSQIVICGLDYKPNRLRGPKMHRGYVSEAAFVASLEYIIKSIFIQMMQGVKKPFLLLNSTPPVTPDHSFSQYFVPEAKRRGVYIHRTIEDNPRLTEEERQTFIMEAGGAESTTNRRENYAEHVIDEANAIVPEFAQVEEEIVREWPEPRCYDAYVGFDFGFNDMTVGLFAYWDFLNTKLVIVDEVVGERCTSIAIVEASKKIELERFKHVKPFLRVADAPLQTLADVAHGQKYHVAPALKDNLEGAVNQLRLMIQSKSIIIHPRCETLISHLKHGVWNKARTMFGRSGDMGHFDAVAAAVYLVRSVAKGKNPYPRYEGLNLYTHHIDQSIIRDSQTNMWRRALRPKVGRR